MPEQTTPFKISRSKRLLQNHDTLIQWIQHGLNFAIVSMTLIVFTLWRDGQMGEQYRVMLVFTLLLMAIIYNLLGVFRRFDTLLGGMQHLARAWGTVVILLAWLAFLTKTSEAYSRQVVVYWTLTAYLAQAITLYCTQRLHRLYRKNISQRVPAIVIGLGDIAKHLGHSIRNNIWLNDQLIGMVHYHSTPNKDETTTSSNLPILGDETQLLEIIKQHNIRRVYMALPIEQSGEITQIQKSLADVNVDLIWAPDIFSLQLLNHSIREVGGVPLINLNETPLRAGGPAFIKLAMDKIIAGSAILALSPILATLALGVKLSSPGPIIFKQVRDGWDGKKFFVFKFRSMYQHEAKSVVEQAKRNDSRITPFGAFIRRTSLDELPQLFNVLNGSMSLVGPRPHAESHNIYYSDKVTTYLARHRIKPGITGLAQINGCRGETVEIEDMQKRVELDLAYICNWSPWLDLKILIATPMRLVSKKGNAY
ncbi:MAG: undecaprenyl-phosphate glucose phosphotransferase [Marinagarivorans sp.]|nr:undecaprenyl-phosphate glucose phosphotransferase [Marinagarivorans sp.]